MKDPLHNQEFAMRFPAPSPDKKILEEGDVFTPKFDAHGLIVCVTTEASTGEILMLAYMNELALEKTLETGVAHYWSRSRKTLWRKGDTSGQVQQVVDISTDCDQDASNARQPPAATARRATPAANPAFIAASSRPARDGPRLVSKQCRADLSEKLVAFAAQPFGLAGQFGHRLQHLLGRSARLARGVAHFLDHLVQFLGPGRGLLHILRDFARRRALRSRPRWRSPKRWR